MSSETLLMALNAAGTIGSGYETGKVLQAAARAHAINGPARDLYMKIADRLGDYEQTQALAALARSERRQ
jgi:DNA polymerase III delta subunit